MRYDCMLAHVYSVQNTLINIWIWTNIAISFDELLVLYVKIGRITFLYLITGPLTMWTRFRHSIFACKMHEDLKPHYSQIHFCIHSDTLSPFFSCYISSISQRLLVIIITTEPIPWIDICSALLLALRSLYWAIKVREREVDRTEEKRNNKFSEKQNRKFEFVCRKRKERTVNE